MTIKHIKDLINQIKSNDEFYRNVSNPRYEYVCLIYYLMMYRNKIGNPINIDIYDELKNNIPDQSWVYRVSITNCYEYYLFNSFRCLISMFGDDFEYALSGLSYKKDISLMTKEIEIIELLIRSVTARKYIQTFSCYIRLFELNNIDHNKLERVIKLIYLYET